MALVAIDLLSEGGAGTKEALSGWRASMTKEQYLSFQRERAREIEFDGGRE
jgi:hypothetical protein